MSLPPALLQRLAQRGLVQKQQKNLTAAENEEVIAEDYDEMENEPHQDNEEEYQYPPLYDNEITVRKPDDSFWLERMRARMGEGNSYAGYKGCPNKYNIYHKCTLYCVNRWEDGHKEPSHEYMRRYRRMLRKYPLPKGWTEHFDPGCGVYYFANETDAVVSWLSPTHPKSVISKSAAMMRRKMDENNGENIGSDGEDDSDDSSTRRSRSPPAKLSAQDFPSLHETLQSPGRGLRKQKERGSGRRHERDSDQEHERERNRERVRERDWDRERGRDRERERDRDRERYGRSHRGRARADTDALDPMDPSAYSDIPRGKWSDGLQQSSEKSKKTVETKRDSGTDEESEHSA